MERTEIVAEMATIAAAGDVLADEQVNRYEELEGMLKAVDKSAEIVKRQAAYATPKMVTGAAADSPDIDRAFAAVLRTGRDESGLIQRAQSEGVGTAGGFLVPEGFRAIIVEKLKAFGGVMGGATNITTATGNPLPWVTNDDTGNTGSLTAEGGALGTGNDLVLGTKMLGAYKYTSNGASGLPLKVSWELAQDSAFDLSSFVARKLAMRIARKVAVALVTGTGASEPEGLLSTAGAISQSTAFSSNSAPTYADFLGVVHALDPAYRDNAVWVFNDKTLKLIRGIVDGNQRPIFWNQLNDFSDVSKGATLLGYPVIIDQACPDPSGSNNFGFFGNLSEAYVVRSVKDVQLVVLNELYATTGQVGYMAWARMDACVQDSSAGVLMLAHS